MADKYLFTITRVYKTIDGSPLLNALTTSWNDGSTLSVESVAQFNDDGGEGVFEPDTERAEVFFYSGIDEDNDRLTGVTRPFTRYAHGSGTFAQEGTDPTVIKRVDGYLEDEEQMAFEIPVPSHLYAYFTLGDRGDDRDAIWVEADEDGALEVASAPVGSVPNFDEDGEVVTIPEPGPPDEGTPSGVVPSAPANVIATPRMVQLLQPTWFIDVSWTHSGLKTDGTTPVLGLHFRVEFWASGTLKFTQETSTNFVSQLVAASTAYEVRVYAIDVVGQTSAPALKNASTSADSTIPTTPSSLTLTGGSQGGGKGIVYASWSAPADTDFSLFEVHVSTTNNFTPSANTLFMKQGGNAAAITKAFNGSSMTTFGYSTTIYVKIRALDTSGNASSYSSQASGSAQQIQNADVTDLSSTNYVSGSSGWAIFKSGFAEFNNMTVRGAVVATTMSAQDFQTLSAEGNGITINGSTNTITLGTGLALHGSASGSGSIQLGFGATVLQGSNGRITIGSSIYLDPATPSIQVGGITMSGQGSGSINVGSGTISGGRIIGSQFEGGTMTGTTFRTGSSGSRVVLAEAGSENDRVKWYGSSGNWVASMVAADGDLQIMRASGAWVKTHDLKVDNVRAFTSTRPTFDNGLGISSGQILKMNGTGRIQYDDTATSATGGGNGAPPGQVRGYFKFELPGGTIVKVPYYNS